MLQIVRSWGWLIMGRGFEGQNHGVTFHVWVIPTKAEFLGCKT